LAIDLANNGYSLGLVARRSELLVSIADSLPTSVLTRTVDVTKGEKAEQILSALIREMGGVDLIVLSSGVGFSNPNLEWDKEAETIDVNVTGFARMVRQRMVRLNHLKQPTYKRSATVSQNPRCPFV